MDKLPRETLMEIFAALPFSERLKCLIVCRAWHNILNSHLFSRIKIIKDPDFFTKVMDLMQQSLEHAVQVRELVLVHTLPGSFNYRLFRNVFPNLQILEMKYSNNHFFRPFPDMSYFPHLKQIKLENICIGIEDLELLQQNLPILQDFDIVQAHIPTSRMPNNVKVLHSINRFTITISGVQDVETHIQVYQYMLRKYVDADKCSCSDFQIHLYDIDTQQSIYENGAMQFIKLNAPKDPFSLRLHGVPNEIDVFRELDNGDYRFNHLEAIYCGDDAFFENLLNSRLSSHIRRITLSDTEMKSPDLLQRLPALSSFSYYYPFHRKEVNLTAYLSGCPKTVRKFSIVCADLVVLPFSNMVTFIENLELKCTHLTPAFGDIISTCFPKLVTLKLSWSLTENTRITLVNDSLKSVEFSNMHGIYGFSYRIENQKSLQHYICYGYQRDPSTYQGIEHLPNLLLITKNRLISSDDVENV